MGFIAMKRIGAAVHSETAASMQHPDRMPFLIIEGAPPTDAMAVDFRS
jgi:hypothetical protein